jgi:hypothetical protein
MIEYTMSQFANKDDMIFAMRAEITTLRAELEKAKSDDCLIQALTDPENQPSQFGTVPIEWYENLENKLELYRFKVGEVIDSLDGSYEKHAIRKALQEAIEQ